MNNPIPKYEAIKYFYDKMTNGSCIIFDDYSFIGKNFNEQRHFIKRFCEEKNISEPLTLPTGQGILIK